MFVTKSRFDEMRRRAERAEDRVYYLSQDRSRLIDKWNAMVARINARGGEAFLEKGRIPSSQPAPFTDEDLQRLIMLCHPDKHDGKRMATEMTQKLLKMKEAVAS
jgi:hypothetical protein